MINEDELILEENMQGTRKNPESLTAHLLEKNGVW